MSNSLSQVTDTPAQFPPGERTAGCASLKLLAGLGLILLFLPPSARATNEAESAVSGAGVAYEIKEVPIQPGWGGAFDPDVILPPAWAFGVLHGYYTDQAGVLRNLDRLKAGDFPVDAIWVDSAFWDLTTKGPKGYLDFRGDRNAFPATKITCDPGAQAVKLHIAAIQGDYRGKLKKRQWKLEMHLSSRPTAVSLNGRPVTWNYDAGQNVLRLDWKSSTAKPATILVTRGAGGR